MSCFFKLFIIWLSLSKLIAVDEGMKNTLFEPCGPGVLVIYPSEMFVKTEQAVDEFSSARFVDARDIPEMLEIYLERSNQTYENVQAIILNEIHGIDNSALSLICEGFLVKCPNLRLLSLGQSSLLTASISSTLCSLMESAPRCVIDLSETEVRNKDVFPLLREIQNRAVENYCFFENRIVFLRRNYLWDAENRVKCYKEKENDGLLSSNWLQRHKDFHNPSTGLGATAKKAVMINLPYPINLVLGVYLPRSCLVLEQNDEYRLTKLSLNTANYSDDEECNLTECSSVDSLYLSQHMVNQYKDHLINVRYIWLEDCGVDADVLRHLREGFIHRCNDLRVLSLAGNAIGAEVVPELLSIWKTSTNCTFVLSHTTFGSYQNGVNLFKRIQEFLLDEESYALVAQKIILMDENTLKLQSHIQNGAAWAKAKLWPSDWQERHHEFWKTYASKRKRISESLVSPDECT